MTTASDLTRQGSAALRSGDRATASHLLIAAVQADPVYEMAWLWLSAALEAPSEKRYCLDRALAANPASQPAHTGIAKLADVLPRVPAALTSVPIAAPPELERPRRRGGRALLVVALVGAIAIAVVGGYLVFAPRSQAEPVAAAGTPAPPTPTPDPCFGALPNFFDRIEPMAREWDDANKLAGQTSRISLAPQIAALQRLRRQAQDLAVPDCATAAKNHLVDSMDLTIEGYLAFMGQKDDATVSLEFKMANNALQAFENELDRLKGLPEVLPTPEHQV